MDLTNLILGLVVLAAGFAVGAALVWLVLRFISGPSRPRRRERRPVERQPETAKDFGIAPGKIEEKLRAESPAPGAEAEAGAVPLAPLKTESPFGSTKDDEGILALREKHNNDYYGYGRAVEKLVRSRLAKKDFVGAALASTEVYSEDQRCRLLIEIAAAAEAAADRWVRYAEEAEGLVTNLPELQDPWRDKSAPEPLMRWQAANDLAKVYESGGMPDRAIRVLALMSQVTLSHVTIREIIGRSDVDMVRPEVEAILLGHRAALDQGETKARTISGDQEDLGVVRLTLCATWAALGDLEQAQAEYAKIPQQREGLRSEAELAMSSAAARRSRAAAAEGIVELARAPVRDAAVAAGGSRGAGARTSRPAAEPAARPRPHLAAERPEPAEQLREKKPAEPQPPAEKTAERTPSEKKVERTPKKPAEKTPAVEEAPEPADVLRGKTPARSRPSVEKAEPKQKTPVEERKSEEPATKAAEPSRPAETKEPEPAAAKKTPAKAAAPPPEEPSAPPPEEPAPPPPEPADVPEPAAAGATAPSSRPNTRQVPVDEIQEAVESGQLSFAEYLAELEVDPDVQQAYRRDVARAYLDSGDLHDARRIAQTLETNAMRLALVNEIDRVAKGESPSPPAGNVTALVIENSAPDEPARQTLVTGFYDRDHAIAWSARWVRASIERFREPKATAKQILERWRAEGFDVMIENERVCADSVEDWAAKPASPEETDYDALAPRLF